MSAFAQTPQSGQGYTDQYCADSRALAKYYYSPSGQLTSIQHYWQRLVNGTYQTRAVLANDCTYDSIKGLKTASSFYVQNPGNTSQFLLHHTETFGYDPNLDYLTYASYNDGMPNPTQSWTYDAAGNRNDSVCDNLNRATSVGGVSCTNDILGNRLTKGGTNYYWDDLNRMVNYQSSGASTSFQYRADGMRVRKCWSAGAASTDTRYRYDGQMGIEDVKTTSGASGSSTELTRYGLGARGIDFIENVADYGGPGGGTTTVSYPIYDAHGNMVANLAKSGTNDYALSNQRSFDAWGNVRIGLSTGNPTGRYCANIGHKQDDESGLIYMRARYYEPTSGRFVSEDPVAEEFNGFAYCSNVPTMKVDEDGRAGRCLAMLGIAMATFWSLMYSWFATALQGGDADAVNKVMKKAFATALTAYATGLAGPLADKLFPTVRKVATQLSGFMNQRFTEAGGAVDRRVDYIIGFYFGYQIFLSFLIDELNDWVNK